MQPKSCAVIKTMRQTMLCPRDARKLTDVWTY